jgi:hypothetical protein
VRLVDIISKKIHYQLRSFLQWHNLRSREAKMQEANKRQKPLALISRAVLEYV